MEDLSEIIDDVVTDITRILTVYACNEAVGISGIITVEVVVPVVGVFANTTTKATNKNLRKGLTYYIDQWK